MDSKESYFQKHFNQIELMLELDQRDFLDELNRDFY